jgi:hypothetical protein
LNSRARRERPEISHESRLSSHKCNRKAPLPHQAEHLHLPWHHPQGRRPKYGTAASRRPSEVCCFCPVPGARIQRFPYRFFRVGSWKENVHPLSLSLALALSLSLHLIASAGKWQARLCIHSNQVNLGCSYLSPEEAARVWDAACVIHYGKVSVLCVSTQCCMPRFAKLSGRQIAPCITEMPLCIYNARLNV